MRRQVRKVMKEVEAIEVTKQEYERINDFYKESLINDGVPFAVVKNTNLNKMILTNGIYRKEFIIDINNNITIDREQDAKERRQYLEELEKEQTEIEKEYAEQMKPDVPNPLD